MDSLNLTAAVAALAASAAFATPAALGAPTSAVSAVSAAVTAAPAAGQVASARAEQKASRSAARVERANTKGAAKTTAAKPSAGGTTCRASHYSEDTQTASGQPFNVSAMKAAHKSLPMGTKLRVTNPANGKSVVVTINDRGPYVGGRCLDLTTGAFRKIANPSSGVITVRYTRL